MVGQGLRRFGPLTRPCELRGLVTVTDVLEAEVASSMS